MSNRSKSTFDAAAQRFRQLAIEAANGELLGSEESLVETLGISRATLRQVARLLEREGVLRVRRGVNGGYFATRPSLSTVEEAVSSYLDSLDMEPNATTVVASVLWVEVIREASSLRTAAAAALAKTYKERLAALPAEAPFDDILALEQESRAAIFALTNARYIELIFQINAAFARKRFSPTPALDDAQIHREFIEPWRKAKALEFQAIGDGDPELGVIAARRSRELWEQRVLARNIPKSAVPA